MLQAVFASYYGIHAELFSIPRDDRNATAAVERRIRQFLGSAGENESLIVAYGGHGMPDPAYHNRTLRWVPARGNNYVEWNQVQENTLFQCEKDTVVLLDSCYAGAADRSVGTSRKDIVAACAWDKTTPIAAPRASGRGSEASHPSFMQLLTRALKSFTTPFTVAQLVAAIRGRGPREDPVYTSRLPDPLHEFVLTPISASGTMRPTPSGPAGAQRSVGSALASRGAAASASLTLRRPGSEGDVIAALVARGSTETNARNTIHAYLRAGWTMEKMLAHFGQGRAGARQPARETNDSEEDDDEEEDEEDEDSD